MAEIRELVLTILDRLSHHALPKNRKRETLDACIQCRPVYRVFLHDLLTKGLSYSVVNSARSALSNYFMGENLSNSEFSIVSHSLIKPYMKGYVCTGQTYLESTFF